MLGELVAHLSSTVKLHQLDEDQRSWTTQFNIPGLESHHQSHPIQESWQIRASGKEFANWKNNIKTPILQFDGASKGNPGMAGGRGTIEEPKQDKVTHYALGLGIESNNRAEALALWQGLQLAVKLRISDLTVIGDSRIIIQAMVKRSKTQSIKLNNLLDKIWLILRNLNSCHFYHVLRDQNRSADKEANQGVLLEARALSVNGIREWVEIP